MRDIDAQLEDIMTICRCVCGGSAGKRTRGSTCVHRSALGGMNGHTLRRIDGLWRRLTGRSETRNLVRVGRSCESISFLFYPGFFAETHPRLDMAVKGNMTGRRCTVTDLPRRANRPVLHPKETLVPRTHPMHETFASLTRREQQRGLLRDSRRIGFEQQWQETLRRSGVTVSGHEFFEIPERGEDGADRAT